MDKPDTKSRALCDLVHGIAEQETGLDGAQIALAYKAALVDFVQQQTSRASTDVVSNILARALMARRQELAERERLTAQRCREWF